MHFASEASFFWLVRTKLGRSSKFRQSSCQRLQAYHTHSVSRQTHLASMSGRGKGGKGLGKGGAKRHRKVLRDNIQGAAALP